MELHRSPPRARRSRDRLLLFRLATEFLTVPLTRQCLFGPALVTRLQVERVLLDVLDDVFLLNLTLESSQGVLDGFTILNPHFSQSMHPHSTRQSIARRAIIARFDLLRVLYFGGYGTLSAVFRQAGKEVLSGEKRPDLRRLLRDQTGSGNRLPLFLPASHCRPFLRG